MEDLPIQESTIEQINQNIELNENLNFSRLIDEKMSYQTRKFEWEALIQPKRIKQIKKDLESKRQRLEHCVNFVWNDELCEEDDKVYIKSPGKPNWYLDMEKDSMSVKLLFCDFYQCVKDKEKIPNEIEILEAMLEFLEN